MIRSLPVSTRFGFTWGIVTVPKYAQCVQVREKYSMAVTGALGEPIDRSLKGEAAPEALLVAAKADGATTVAPTSDSRERRYKRIITSKYSVIEFSLPRRLVNLRAAFHTAVQRRQRFAKWPFGKIRRRFNRGRRESGQAGRGDAGGLLQEAQPLHQLLPEGEVEAL